MTAEIGIMNKGAIALAADSAVTIGAGEKTYNTANKLFMLSKYHPVGIMIYGNAQLMGIPWETIVKVYRQELGDKPFLLLKEYAMDFISFIEKGSLIDIEEQHKYFNRTVANYYKIITRDITTEVETVIKSQSGKIKKSAIPGIVNVVIDTHYNRWLQSQFVSDLDQTHCNDIMTAFNDKIEKIINLVFQDLPLSKTSTKKLKNIAASLFCKDRISTKHSGVVIAGFGEKEIFPSMVALRIDGIFENKVKYTQDLTEITYENEATVNAFAQDEMARAFMEGIDPNFNSAINGFISNVFSEYNKSVVESLADLSPEERKKLEAKLSKLSKKIGEEFRSGMQEYSQEEHVNPIMDAVGILPKEELAIMAESLVNITSFKRKMTLDVESVGGPIDVAVISKGDGFVWVKRKHYFKSELNYAFFSNYFKTKTEEC